MSLIAWYPLNGDTKDYSGNNFHLTNDGATVDARGKIGSCYNFVSLKPMNYTGWILPQGTTWKDFTVSAWIYPTETPTQHGYNVLSFNRNAMIRFRLTANNLLWVLWGGETGSDYANCESNGKIPLNTWTHIACRLNNGIMSLYINGRLDKTHNTQKDIKIIGNTLYVGGHNPSDARESWRGKLNDVRIYNEALTTKQIKEIAQAKICHYTFNEEMYENTTNLYANYPELSGIVTADNDNCKIDRIKLDNGHYRYKIYKKVTKNNWPNVQFPVYTFTPGKQYTISIDIKIIEKRNKAGIQLRHSAINNDYGTPGRQTISLTNAVWGQWKRYTLTRSFETTTTLNGVTHNTSPRIEIYTDMHNEGDYLEFEIKNYQVEEKDHATPFTPNSRTQTLKDISGYGHHMTTYTEYSPVWKQDNSDIRIKGYSTLSDKASYYCENFQYKYPDAFTFSCWIKTTDNEAFCVVGFPYGNNAAVSLSIYNKKIHLHSYFSTPEANRDQWYATSTKAINDDKWHLVTVTYDGAIAKSYIDGKYEASDTVTFDFVRERIRSLFINMPSANLGGAETRRFNGDITDVRIYATALSDEDVKLLYQPEISIDKSNVIRCSEINEEKINNNKIGFYKNASITYNEFNEVPNIKSGVHNVKLGNEILPVLIDMDKDGGRWARVFYHNCRSGTVLFSGDNSYAEAKETNKNAPTGVDKYSILSKLESFRPNTKSAFEFRLRYPTNTNDCNIWKQTSNPTYQKVTGYVPVQISWTTNVWGGLEYSGYSAFIDGSVDSGSWYYAIGASSKYGDGIPKYNGFTTNDVELWVRINNYDLFADNLISNVSISRDGVLTAKEFREI